MDMSFYAAATGAGAHKDRMNIVANNISNISTVGFKAEDAVFSDLIYNELNPPALDGTQLSASAGARIDKTNTNFSQGDLMKTDGKYDYAILGAGFFALLNPETQEVTFTRDGAFRLSEQIDGRFFLTSHEGKPVLDKNMKPIEVKGDEQILPVSIFRFKNVDGMLHIGHNEFRAVPKNGAPIFYESGDALKQGFIENSNVDMAEEFAKMIEAQRAYQYALKMVQTSDEVENTINTLR